MGFSLTSPAPEKGDPTAEKRVWGFFGETQQSHRENRPQPKQPRQGNRLNTTKIVLGRTYWPSRDPIGENGGIHLYGMAGNKLVNSYDILGLFDPDDPDFQGGAYPRPRPKPRPDAKPPKPAKKRDCVNEALECAARGVIFCSIVEKCVKVGSKYAYRSCALAYAGACAKQKASCDKENEENGF